MGTNTYSTKNPGDIISSDDPNQYKEGLSVDVVPRNSSGIATDLAGALGSLLYRWSRIFTNAITLGAISNGLKIEDDSGDIVLKVDDTVVVRVNSSGITKSSISSSSSFTSASSGEQTINATVDTAFGTITGTIVTTGQPVLLKLIASGDTTTGSSITANFGTAGGHDGRFRWVRGTTTVAQITSSFGGSPSSATYLPISFVDFIDFPAAGTHAYSLQFRKNSSASGGCSIAYLKLHARELI